MIRQNGPLRRWATDAGATIDRLVDNTDASFASQFPRCALHGVRLIDRLPRHCPLSTARPGEVMERIRSLAFKELDRKAHSGDAITALHALRVAEVCETCVRQLIGHPAIRRLRSQLGVTSE